MLLDGVVRTRGRVFVANRLDDVMWIESADGGVLVESAGTWLAAKEPNAKACIDPERRALAAMGWDARFGDRHISMAVLVCGAQTAEIDSALRGALLTDGTVETMLRRLNPRATLLRTVRGEVDLAEILDTGKFDPLAAEQTPGWDEEIAGGHTPETEEYGISSMTFRAGRPFHPQRLADVLDEARGLLRSKGFCWIASRPDIVAIWSQAGPNLVFEPAQYWSTTDLEPGQEIVFIGIRLDRERLRHLLRSALLDDSEYAAGEQEWLGYPDPLPAWVITHTH